MVTFAEICQEINGLASNLGNDVFSYSQVVYALSRTRCRGPSTSTRPRRNGIVNGKRGITADTAGHRKSPYRLTQCRHRHNVTDRTTAATAPQSLCRRHSFRSDSDVRRGFLLWGLCDACPSTVDQRARRRVAAGITPPLTGADIHRVDPKRSCAFAPYGPFPVPATGYRDNRPVARLRKRDTLVHALTRAPSDTPQ